MMRDDYQSFFKIYLPLLIVVGLLVFLAFAVAVTRRRVFQQHTVSVYLTSIAITAIILLPLDPGIYWMQLLLLPADPLLYFTCRFWSFFVLTGISFLNWLPVFALIDRYLTATKSKNPPLPAFCSMFGARLTTCIVVTVCLFCNLPNLSLYEITSFEFDEGKEICVSQSSYAFYYYYWGKVFNNYIPFVITVIMCFVAGCSRKSSEFQSVDQQEDQTGQQLSRFVVTMSAINVAVRFASIIGDEIVFYYFDRYILGLEFIGLIISFLVGFAMVPALRREVKDALTKNNKGDDAEKPGDSEKQRILMPAMIAKDS